MKASFPSPRRAFTLIELLVVISIIGIVAVFVVPAASTIILGTELTRASQTLSGQLAAARQSAVAKQHAIEVRFIQFPDPEQPGENVDKPDTWNYRAIMLMEILENGNAVVLGKPERLPGSIQMNKGMLSSLLDEKGEAEPSNPVQMTPKNANSAYDPPLPRLPKAQATKYRYVSFRFLPDGSTNLDARNDAKWYITLHTAADANRLNASQDPASMAKQINYFTVQIDPATGSTRNYRPTLKGS